MAEVEMKWYVLRAVSGKEAKVKEYIDAENQKRTSGRFCFSGIHPDREGNHHSRQQACREGEAFYAGGIFL